MKRAILSIAVTAVLAALLGASALGSPATTNTLVISHVTKGCHTWSLNGAKPAVHQTIRLRAGQSFMLRNSDVMPHQLVKVSGPMIKMQLVSSGMMSSGMMKAPYAHGMMPHMASTLRVTFPKAGTYMLKTKAGEDHTSGIKTVGEDNVLRLRVIVG